MFSISILPYHYIPLCKRYHVLIFFFSRACSVFIHTRIRNNVTHAPIKKCGCRKYILASDWLQFIREKFEIHSITRCARPPTQTPCLPRVLFPDAVKRVHNEADNPQGCPCLRWLWVMTAQKMNDGAWCHAEKKKFLSSKSSSRWI